MKKFKFDVRKDSVVDYILNRTKILEDKIKEHIILHGAIDFKFLRDSVFVTLDTYEDDGTVAYASVQKVFLDDDCHIAFEVINNEFVNICGNVTESDCRDFSWHFAIEEIASIIG